MSTHCNTIHPLNRAGVNQYQRVLAALLPDFARVDEREYPDLLLFAKNYASFLNYYNKDNTAEGDWKPFMLMDVSVTLAELSRLDIQEYISYSKDIYDKIGAAGIAEEGSLKDYFKALFDLCFSITTLLDNYYTTLPADFEFREVLGNALHSGLPEYFDRLNKYYLEAINQGLIDQAGTFRFDDRPRELIFSQHFHVPDPGIWNDPGPIDPAVPPFTPAFNGTSTALKIKNTASHNLFTAITDQYLKVLARIVKAAPAYLDRSMEDFPTHSPHYALFLAFIKLFRISQDSLNNFTARHLDLYYRDILKLNKKAPEPDTVHLLFELAKTAGAGVLLEPGTLFKAGKDKDGLELFYRLKEQALLGKGKVAALRNTHSDRRAGADGPVRRISAGAMANSGDGMGAPLLHTDKSWSAFGEAGRLAGAAGFGIASDYLFLQEGKRVITFTFQVSGKIPPALSPARLDNHFTVELSSEKGWFPVPAAATKTSIAGNRTSFSVEITLNGGDPAVLPYAADIHGYQFKQALPMALFSLVDGAATEDLWNLRISEITLNVRAEEISNLKIENDEGALNPAKPFDLFGAAPYRGSAFILGCRELFMKTRQPLGDITGSLTFTWDNHDALTEAFDENQTVATRFLENADWKNETSFSPQPLFTLSGGSPVSDSTLEFALPALEVEPVFGDEPDYAPGGNFSSASKWGFLKLSLEGDFGHADYAKNLAESVKVTSADDGEGNVTTSIDMGSVKAPVTPRVKEIKLSYQVSTRLDISRPGGRDFVHLAPFGHTVPPDGQFPAPLLPQFPNEGELYIGLEQLQTGQTLPLLFQVAEGTADPLAEKQEITWHYLDADDKWKPFLKEDVADATGGLLKSGIIKFSIPARRAGTGAADPGALAMGISAQTIESSPRAAGNSALMGGELYWLKASVAENTRAIPRLIAVSAQAAAAQFCDHKSEGNYFKQPLPAGSISKLLTGNPAIKKIEQPSASIGGRTRENEASWYRWVSERLRHKQRAIAAWDYERLVLEAFPGIYKVKCITHTQLNNELSPGHVLVVPVPDLHDRNAFDPLRPRASLGLLEDIKKFLSGIASPHVQLEVCNPLFEEIQLEFNVQYRSDDVEFFTKQLRAELEQFMAPWAFDSGSDIEFGAGMNKSTLINFIEERPYVDYLSCVKMYCISEGVRSNDLETALAKSARSVFVSVKGEGSVYSHIINENVCTC